MLAMFPLYVMCKWFGISIRLRSVRFSAETTWLAPDSLLWPTWASAFWRMIRANSSIRLLTCSRDPSGADYFFQVLEGKIIFNHAFLATNTLHLTPHQTSIFPCKIYELAMGAERQCRGNKVGYASNPIARILRLLKKLNIWRKQKHSGKAAR